MEKGASEAVMNERLEEMKQRMKLYEENLRKRISDRDEKNAKEEQKDKDPVIEEVDYKPQ
jgi:hypothetical protein